MKGLFILTVLVVLVQCFQAYPQPHSRPKYGTNHGTPYDDKPRTYEEKSKVNEEKAKPNEEKAKPNEEKVKPYGDKARTYEERVKPYGDRAKSYEDKAEVYGKVSRYVDDDDEIDQQAEEISYETPPYEDKARSYEDNVESQTKVLISDEEEIDEDESDDLYGRKFGEVLNRGGYGKSYDRDNDDNNMYRVYKIKQVVYIDEYSDNQAKRQFYDRRPVDYVEKRDRLAYGERRNENL